MRSSFFEFNVAISSLHVARAGLDTVNHNISNAANPAYSRQYVQQRAARPLNFYNGRGMIGTGAEVYGVGQIRDAFLDNRYWGESAVLGEYSAKQTQLELIEKIFNAMGSSGFTATFDDLFGKLQDLVGNSGDSTYRTNLIMAGQTLSRFVNSTAESLKQQQSDLNSDIQATVQIINGIGVQIRALNEQISRLEIDGSRANDLRDARTNLIDSLSKIVNVEVREIENNDDYAAGKYPDPSDGGKSDKRFIVLINGQEFVNHYDVNQLRVERREEKVNPMDVPDLYDIYFENSNRKFDMYHPNLKGELKALIDLRDGNNGFCFTKTQSSTTGITILPNGNQQISMTNPTRGDLNPTGVMTFYNPATGYEVEIEYKNFKYDPDSNEATFELVTPLDTSKVNVATDKITVGETSNYKGIPHYLNKLNNLVRTFSKAFNEGKAMDGSDIPGLSGHINGYDQHGGKGNLFFSYTGIYADSNVSSADGSIINYNLMNCGNFSVDEKLIGNPWRVAASKNIDTDESDNQILLELLAINTTKTLFSEGKISDYVVGMAGELGIDLKQATNFSINYSDVTTTIDNQRKSVSGVSLDEEMINMVKYNQLFMAASKLINTIDNIYDTLINRLGV